MVVVQVVEGSLPTPEIHSSNSVIGKFYFLSNCIEKMNKEKICQEWPNLKKMIWICITDVGRVQVVERSLPIPQIRGSNPVVGNLDKTDCFRCLREACLACTGYNCLYVYTKLMPILRL